MRRPRLYQALALIAAGVAPAVESDQFGPRWIGRLPGFMNVGPIKAWTSVRDLPPSPERSFRTLWRERRKAGNR